MFVIATVGFRHQFSQPRELIESGTEVGTQHHGLQRLELMSVRKGVGGAERQETHTRFHLLIQPLGVEFEQRFKHSRGIVVDRLLHAEGETFLK